MDDHQIVIVGGGPTGLMLAGEVALARVDAVIVERRTSQALERSRAGGLGTHARTLEVFDQRGIVDRFLAEGQTSSTFAFATVPLDLGSLPTRHPYLLALRQRHLERLLAGWVEELGVPILRGREVTGLEPDRIGVTVALADGTAIRAAYVVGCDGGRSIVRKSVGIKFPGLDATASWMIAEADMDEAPPIGTRPEGGGIGPVERGQTGGPYGIVLREPEVDHGREPTAQDLRDTLVAVYGTDFGVHDPTWVSRFTDATRQAAEYRRGRVLLAGDAAHVHPPQGGQGLSTGVQDAVNLGWKLGQVVKGISADSLLDTYQAERHPVGARVLQLTRSLVALTTQDGPHDALRSVIGELVGLDEPRRRIAERITGLDIRYDLGEGHPLVGWRMPDLELETADGPVRVFELLHEARPVLMDLGDAGRSSFALGPWADRVRVVAAATREATWALPVVGHVDPAPAVLIRPDGHVAWAGELSDPALPLALKTWFGGAG